MGTCQGNRNTYSNPMQKACTNFENKMRLYTRDWKMMVGAIRSYCPEDGTAPEGAIRRVMQEMGMCSVYDDKTTKLKDLMTEFLKDQVPQRTWLIYFALFMCDGNEAAKMEYLCWTMNGMDMQKTTVPGETFREVLLNLMKLSVVTIPTMGDIKQYKDEIMKQTTADALTKWCPDCNKETLTVDEVRSWGAKCHNFTPGEARAAMLKLAIPEPPPTEKKTEKKDTIAEQSNEKTAPKVEKTTA